MPLEITPRSRCGSHRGCPRWRRCRRRSRAGRRSAGRSADSAASAAAKGAGGRRPGVGGPAVVDAEDRLVADRARRRRRGRARGGDSPPGGSRRRPPRRVGPRLDEVRRRLRQLAERHPGPLSGCAGEERRVEQRTRVSHPRRVDGGRAPASTTSRRRSIALPALVAASRAGLVATMLSSSESAASGRRPEGRLAGAAKIRKRPLTVAGARGRQELGPERRARSG